MTAPVAVHRVIDGPEDAPALVLSNSLGSTLATWDPQVPELSRRFRVIRYDHRGHGGSPVPPGPYPIQDLGADVVKLLDELGVERAHVCGLSLGGLVAMWLAANEAARVDRLVLCSTAAWFGPPEPFLERAALVRARGAEAVADAVVGRWFTAGFADGHPDEVRRMREMIASTPAEGYAACAEVVARTDLRPDLARIAAPTLVIGGSEDPAVPAARIDEIAGGIAGCRSAFVAAAHLANVEAADAVTALIAEHLGGTDGGGSP